MKNLIFAIFLVLVCLSPFVSAQGYDRAKLWDKEIEALTEIDLKQTPPKDAVLFVGSSSIRLWKNLRASFPGLNVINRGFGGSRLEDSVYYFDRIVAPYNPKTIVLYAGENDINEGVTPEKVLDDYKRFSALVRLKFPKAKLIFVSLKPSPSRWSKADALQKANALVKTEIAKDRLARFVDVWTPMLGANGEPLPDIFVADKLHMNEKGYAIWRDALMKYLK
jgi:lysophospholipase L1-like esterase